VAGCDRRLVTRPYLIPPPYPSSLAPMKALRGFVGSRPSTMSEPQSSTSAVFPNLRKLDLPADQSHDSPLLTLDPLCPFLPRRRRQRRILRQPLVHYRNPPGSHQYLPLRDENITSVAKSNGHPGPRWLQQTLSPFLAFPYRCTVGGGDQQRSF
jgi:hypothetical protein